MRVIDRSAQRCHGRDATAFNAPTCFGDFLLERACRITVPIDFAERLEGFRRIRLHRHQVVSIMGFDDAASGIPDGVQRVYGDDPSGEGHFFKKRQDGRLLAILVMKPETDNGRAGVMGNQGCGFEGTVPIAVRDPEALAIGGHRRADVEARRSPPV